MIKSFFTWGLNAHISCMCLSMRIQITLRDMHVGGRGYTAGGGFDGGESVFVCLKRGGGVTMPRCHPAAPRPQSSCSMSLGHHQHGICHYLPDLNVEKQLSTSKLFPDSDQRSHWIFHDANESYRNQLYIHVIF